MQNSLQFIPRSLNKKRKIETTVSKNPKDTDSTKVKQFKQAKTDTNLCILQPSSSGIENKYIKDISITENDTDSEQQTSKISINDVLPITNTISNVLVTKQRSDTSVHDVPEDTNRKDKSDQTSDIITTDSPVTSNTNDCEHQDSDIVIIDAPDTSNKQDSDVVIVDDAPGTSIRTDSKQQDCDLVIVDAPDTLNRKQQAFDVVKIDETDTSNRTGKEQKTSEVGISGLSETANIHDIEHQNSEVVDCSIPVTFNSISKERLTSEIVISDEPIRTFNIEPYVTGNDIDSEQLRQHRSEIFKSDLQVSTKSTDEQQSAEVSASGVDIKKKRKANDDLRQLNSEELDTFSYIPQELDKNKESSFTSVLEKKAVGSIERTVTIDNSDKDSKVDQWLTSVLKAIENQIKPPYRDVGCLSPRRQIPVYTRSKMDQTDRNGLEKKGQDDSVHHSGRYYSNVSWTPQYYQESSYQNSYLQFHVDHHKSYDNSGYSYGYRPDNGGFSVSHYNSQNTQRWISDRYSGTDRHFNVTDEKERYTTADWHYNTSEQKERYTQTYKHYSTGTSHEKTSSSRAEQFYSVTDKKDKYTRTMYYNTSYEKGRYSSDSWHYNYSEKERHPSGDRHYNTSYKEERYKGSDHCNTSNENYRKSDRQKERPFGYPREWEYTEFGHAHKKQPPVSDQLDFTVMSYNVLAQNLLEDNSYLYTHCRSYTLEWDYRKMQLLKEFKYHKPDILCLQEVNVDHFEDFFKPELRELGYEGKYIKRSGDKEDGCATFYRTSLFTLDTAIPIHYKQPNKGDVLDRDNVALVLKLIPKLKGEGHPMTSKRLLISNTHLLFNPRRGDIKLAQLMVLLAELDKYANLNRGGNKDFYHALIMCGDFNLEPQSDIYKFLITGRLEYDGLPRSTMSGQMFDYRRYTSPRLDRNFFPSSVGINDNCQYCEIVNQRKKDVITLNVEDDLITNVQGTGLLTHQIKLLSAYLHRIGRFNHDVDEVTTHHGQASCTVDFIFYGIESAEAAFIDEEVQVRKVKEGQLRLVGRYGLISDDELEDMGSLPNKRLGSDHLCLIARFLLS